MSNDRWGTRRTDRLLDRGAETSCRSAGAASWMNDRFAPLVVIGGTDLNPTKQSSKFDFGQPLSSPGHASSQTVLEADDLSNSR